MREVVAGSLHHGHAGRAERGNADPHDEEAKEHFMPGAAMSAAFPGKRWHCRCRGTSGAGGRCGGEREAVSARRNMPPDRVRQSIACAARIHRGDAFERRSLSGHKINFEKAESLFYLFRPPGIEYE